MSLLNKAHTIPIENEHKIKRFKEKQAKHTQKQVKKQICVTTE